MLFSCHKQNMCYFYSKNMCMIRSPLRPALFFLSFLLCWNRRKHTQHNTTQNDKWTLAFQCLVYTHTVWRAKRPHSIRATKEKKISFFKDCFHAHASTKLNGLVYTNGTASPCTTLLQSNLIHLNFKFRNFAYIPWRCCVGCLLLWLKSQYS